MDLETAGMTGGGGEGGSGRGERAGAGRGGDGDAEGTAGPSSSVSSLSSSSSSFSSSPSPPPPSLPSDDSLVRAIPHPWEHVTDADLERAARSLTSSSLLQSPPMFSAVSVKGERLYLAARRGERVERPAREISVTRFDVRRRGSRLLGEGEGGGAAAGGEGPPCPDVDFRVACSKGTYVRVLAADLGTAAGTAAHLVALRRTRIGAASVEDAWPLLDLVAAVRGEEETPEEREQREERERARRREREQQRTRGMDARV